MKLKDIITEALDQNTLLSNMKSLSDNFNSLKDTLSKNNVIMTQFKNPEIQSLFQNYQKLILKANADLAAYAKLQQLQNSKVQTQAITPINQNPINNMQNPQTNLPQKPMIANNKPQVPIRP